MNKVVKYLAIVTLICYSIFLVSGCSSKEQAQDNTGSVIMNYDDNGKSVKTVYHDVPQKVLVLYPGATEVMLELGLEQNVLATVSPYGSEPEQIADKYKALPKIKAAYIPALEEVFAMQPDLIIGWAHNFSPTELGSVYDWKAHDIPVYIVPATLQHDLPTLENSVYPFLTDMGIIFQCQDKANAYVEQLKQKVSKVNSAVADKPKKTAIVLQDHGKSSYSLYGPNYLITDILAKAGLTNLVQTKTSFVGPERILGYDPDYIIFVSLPDKDGNDLTDEEVIKLVTSNKDLTSLRAVQEKRIINIPFAQVNSGNGRAVDALVKIYQARQQIENF